MSQDRPFGISTAMRVYLQTTEEWLQEYETGVPVCPAAISDKEKRAGFRAWYAALYRDSGVDDVKAPRPAPPDGCTPD
jgi:hypothetical protein